MYDDVINTLSCVVTDLRKNLLLRLGYAALKLLSSFIAHQDTDAQYNHSGLMIIKHFLRNSDWVTPAGALNYRWDTKIYAFRPIGGATENAGVENVARA